MLTVCERSIELINWFDFCIWCISFCKELFLDPKLVCQLSATETWQELSIGYDDGTVLSFVVCDLF